jgi:hypothetical protein
LGTLCRGKLREDFRWSDGKVLKPKQRESVVKYLYDLSKGVALLTVVSPWVTDRWSWATIVLGTIAAGMLFLWAYWLEGTDDAV